MTYFILVLAFHWFWDETKTKGGRYVAKAYVRRLHTRATRAEKRPLASKEKCVCVSFHTWKLEFKGKTVQHYHSGMEKIQWNIINWKIFQMNHRIKRVLGKWEMKNIFLTKEFPFINAHTRTKQRPEGHYSSHCHDSRRANASPIHAFIPGKLRLT